MKLPQKAVFAVAAAFFANFTFGQTLQDGITSIDSHKYAQAKQNFEQMVSKSPSAENYFYLGNTYLTQNEPDWATAEQNFRKGLAEDSKSYLNRIGLATIKLGKGDKSAVAEIQNIVKDSREKDAEVLFRAGQALTLFEKNNNPELAIQYLDKAVERAMKGGVPAPYYYTLGDAYRLQLTNSPQVAGKAMSAYEKALPLAKNKASVYTRMGTLWMQANQWKMAKERITQAISTDPTYAPAYRALAGYEMKFQQPQAATQALVNYAKYADEDPGTQLEISKLYFTNQDYANSRAVLDKVFNVVEDPIKYKLRAYLDYADGKYTQAQTDLNTFINTVTDKSRIYPADRGLEGLILAGLAKDEKDAAKKSSMMIESQQKIAIAKNAKDETLNWDNELLKIQGGGASSAAANAGPTNPAIEALKKQTAANPNDADALVKLGSAYQEAQNWNGAILTWDKMIALSPTWAYSYYAKGAAYQQLGNEAMAESSYQKFIDTVLTQKPEEQAAQKETLSYAYYLVAYFNQTKDVAKARDYAAKAVQLNPGYEDAVNLNANLNK
ncbi:tetratricopeptide repeat protein [Marnyiella aurantia]|uniref:tetratricopeptide repeat protein n=1 Tax=Marnyiella aurantia TaxID=2758037 RepID=UPI001FD75A02|nr:tetratricopeptide repeat protein [Marnyiella aurantia]